MPHSLWILPPNACVEFGRPGRTAQPIVSFVSSDEHCPTAGDSRHPAAAPFGAVAVKGSRTACRTSEKSAEVLHQLQPAFAAHVQPLEDRRELLWNRAALVGAQLPPRPVEQIEESGDAFAPRQGCQRLAGG